MKVGLRRVLTGIAALVVLALGALAIFLWTFDPNAYKGKFEEFVHDRYGRTLSIEGDIELSLFPRIGLSVQNVSLSNPDAPDDLFASMDSARLAVAIWPLLSNRFVVDHVAISGFKAWIRRDEQGEYNFHDLFEGVAGPSEPIALAPDPGPAAEPEPSVVVVKEAFAQPLTEGGTLPARPRKEAALHVDIAGLELKGGEIHYLDVKRAKAARLVNLQLNTGRMTFDQPFDVSMRGALQGEDPRADATIEGQALVKIDPLLETYSAQKLNVQLSGAVGPLDAKTVTLRGNFAYNGYSRMLDASGVEMLVQGAVQGNRSIQDLNATLTMPRLKVDQTHSEFNIQRMSLRATGTMPDKTFDVAFDAPRLSISPETADGEPVAGTVKLEGRQTVGLALSMNGLGGNAWNLSLKELKVDGNLKDGEHVMLVNMSTPVQWDVINEKGTFSAIRGDVAIQNTEEPANTFEFPLIGSLHADLMKDEISSEINAVLNGAPLNFNLKATNLSDPKLQFALQAEMLDFDKLLPAPKPAPAAEQPDAEEADKTEQAAEAQNETPDKAEAQPSPIDLTLLNNIDVEGTIKLGGLNISGVEATDFNMSVAARDGKLNLSGISAKLYDGSLVGTFSATSRNQFAGKFDLTQASMGPLVRALSGSDRLSGKGNVAIDLKSEGSTPAALKGGLNGSASLQLREGAIRGIDLNQTLAQVGGILTTVLGGEGPSLPTAFNLGSRTSFDSLDVSLAIKNGVADVRKLDLRSPLLRITQGKPASINLVHNSLDLLANVRVVRAGDDSVNLSALRGMTVPVRFAGPLNGPRIDVQWQDMGGSLVKDAIQRGLTDLVGGQGNADPASAAEPNPAAPLVEDPVKSLGKTLKGLLGG
ncbi:AsmA family protein [Pusillimonas sp.]|uniref:AsmA family protein n=1 Tax=Pusillimonas sp. TaxID=3040095 RepID=UPI0037C538FD